MKFLSYFVILLLASLNVLGQQKAVDLILTNSSISNLDLYLYNPHLIIKPVLKDTIEAINAFPEQLITSVLSANTQEWIDYNTLGGSNKSDKIKPEDLEFRKSMNKEKNYNELVSKLSFSANGSEMAMIKFYFHTEKLPMAYSGVAVTQKINNRWYTTSQAFTSPLALLLMRFDSNKLKKVLDGRPTQDKQIDDLIRKIKVGNSIDLEKLIKEFNAWYSTNDKEKIEFFIDKNAW